MIKKCKYCKKEFEALRNNKYCTKICSNLYRKQNHRQYMKEYRRKNIQKIRQNILKNLIKIRKIRNEYNRKYFKNPINQLKRCLRVRLIHALKNNVKSKKTIELIGCSVEFLKIHLESQFIEGMNWKNYGKWEIDHIRPCVSFDLSKKSEQLKCFNYTNLQPLWAMDNRKKGQTNNV